MAKTVFSDGNASTGLLGTIITAAFLNALNNHRHTGRDIDGEGALDYATTGGSANAYTLTFSQTLDAYIPGMPIYFKASFTNTGAATLAIGSLSAVAIKTLAGNDLASGDITSGQLCCVCYDGAQMILMSSAATEPLSVRDLQRGLIIKNNATNPNYQLAVSADEVILQNSSGNSRRIASLSATVDITASGAGGLDTGSEAVSTWYHIWAIAKADGTKSVLLSTSSTSPTLPTSYTYKAYLGAIYNNSSGNFITLYQRDRHAYTTETAVGSSLSATSYTALSLASIVPATAAAAIMSGYTLGSYIPPGYVKLSKDSSGIGETILYGWGDGNSSSSDGGRGEIFIESQAIYYKVCGNGGYISYLYCSGWRF